ncbi:MAG: arginine--tRNA ligase [Cryomorphaceae bacterium BACL21 MAG-121220-bin10]|jgi:arginyl-tRNA synthetase|nr:MAG: arginine--tRNA ligase [Cryomorphaceae bacterium BACL21 MAG-121220-bin10]
MSIEDTLKHQIILAAQKRYGQTLDAVEFQTTRKDFVGDLTVVIFPLLRVIKGNPLEIGTAIGDFLTQNVPEIKGFNVVKGFLNLSFEDAYFINTFDAVADYSHYGWAEPNGETVMVEYSSPNTNKPLHLGHIRNNLLGFSVSEILKASGKTVYKTQIINDRGIHICKSMWAWQHFGNGQTPLSTGLKGDKLVGNYYVIFDQKYKEQVRELVAQGHSEEDAAKQAPSLQQAQELLRLWEAGDAEVVALWSEMNQWVYDGFETTYRKLGVDFDQNYYESNTYLLGKEHIQEGLEKGVFYQKEDGSVWCDLTQDGLDHKLVLRSDGTSVYMTQDIGTAIQRSIDYPKVTGMTYTVGNEQDYHFKVLFLILGKLGYPWAKHLYHLSYGMVDLPSGKMKSREGTVVDADDLIHEMQETAREIAQGLGKIDDLAPEEKTKLFEQIGLGALKYYILKVDPKKRILFDPEESVDFQGNTGPFIQYTYARIQSIGRKAQGLVLPDYDQTLDLHDKERSVLKLLKGFPEKIQEAALHYSPALIANYTYELVKEFNSFYQNVPILTAEIGPETTFRVALSQAVADVIKTSCSLLGMEVPERM